MTPDYLHITICPKESAPERSLSFLDILFDETLLYGAVYIPKPCFDHISTLNHRLPCKQVYELVLRLAGEYPVLLTDTPPATDTDCVSLCVEPEPFGMDSLRVDAYLISRYKKLLQDQQLFDAAVTGLLDAAGSIGAQDEIVSFLSDMLSEGAAYEYYYAGSQPFLIYTGDTVCYGILSVFAEQFGAALRRLGYLVEYFDLSKKEFTEAYRFIGRRYQAVIGVQSYMFSAKLSNGTGFMHDTIKAPKYNFLFDHPTRAENHLTETPKRLTILTVDRDYAVYAKKTYPVNAVFFPPGGICTAFKEQERIYDVTFIGSYFDAFSFVLNRFSKFDRKHRFLANRFGLIMKKSPSLPAEKALSLALEHYHMELTRTEFADLFHMFRDLILCLAAYYRMKTLKSLTEAGIPVHVFGKSWKSCPLHTDPNFIWHDRDLSTEECLSIWQRSKISLNTMTWHKDGITERILNSMLQKAVVVTERNPYMEEAFCDGRDVLLYELDSLDALPGMVRDVLSDPKRLSAIAENGYCNALANHTWDSRAKEFIRLTEEESKGAAH